MTRAAWITRRSFLALTGASATVGLSRQVRAGEPRRPVVLELFTSQGCSSCPPADALMQGFSRRKGVIALSFNVDYWDYLGWRDTLGSPDHTRRQRDYAERRGDGQVYTPQMVINGEKHIVGSQEQAILGALKQEGERSGDPMVQMSIRDRAGEVVVDVAGAPVEKLRLDSTVWLMMVAPRIGVTIERGENTGRTIEYYNVVRKMIPAGMWHGEAVSLALPKSDLFTEDAHACAALLQVGGTGPIIGAVWMSEPGT